MCKDLISRLKRGIFNDEVWIVLEHFKTAHEFTFYVRISQDIFESYALRKDTKKPRKKHAIEFKDDFERRDFNSDQGKKMWLDLVDQGYRNTTKK